MNSPRREIVSSFGIIWLLVLECFERRDTVARDSALASTQATQPHRSLPALPSAFPARFRPNRAPSIRGAQMIQPIALPRPQPPRRNPHPTSPPLLSPLA